MAKLLKFFLGIVCLAGAIYAGSLVYYKWYLSGGISKAASEAQKSGSQVLNQAKNSVISGAQAAINKNVSDLAKWAGGGLYSLGESLMGVSSTPIGTASGTASTESNFFNNQVLPAPSSTDGSYSVPPPTVSLLTHVNVPIAISLIADGSYEANWGDGSMENGVGSGLDKVTVISHSWTEPGNYDVRIVASASGSLDSYSFPVQVLK